MGAGKSNGKSGVNEVDKAAIQIEGKLQFYPRTILVLLTQY